MFLGFFYLDVLIRIMVLGNLCLKQGRRISNIPSYLMLPIKPSHSQLPNTPRTDRFWEWLRIIGSKTLPGGGTALSKPFSMQSEDGKRLRETLKALVPILADAVKGCTPYEIILGKKNLLYPNLC